jgi:CBS domain-containing protein
MTVMTDASSAVRWMEELRLHPPFAALSEPSVQALVASAQLVGYQAGEVVCSPEHGVAHSLWWVRHGAVQGQPAGPAPRQGPLPAFQLETGEMFSMGAVIGRRPVTTVYRAVADLECLRLDAEAFRRLVQAEPVLADYVNGRLQHLLALSQRALQGWWVGQIPVPQPLDQLFDRPLSALRRRAPVAVSPHNTLHAALRLMNERGVGSVLALDEKGAAVGILTRHDMLPRVALAEPPLDTRRTPFSAVMTQPVHTLDVAEPVQQAAVLMSRHGIRHVPLTEGGRVVSLVSERDLFALQRRSLRQLGAELRAAPDIELLKTLAPEIPALARDLLAQGVAARTLTQLVAQLNDSLVERVVHLLAQQHGLDLRRACWVAFGSEGRGEQTIATDQDNGLVLDDEVDDAERLRWLAMAREVNQALDACGFPLCKGGIMAGEPACTQTRAAWAAAFTTWMGQGEPEHLLKAAIFFDLRPIAGNAGLAVPLRQLIRDQAPRQPRFLRLLAAQSLHFRPALNWLGGLESQAEEGHQWLDLKLHGTAVFVDTARFLALAHGQVGLGTRERLLDAGEAMGVPRHERESWAAAFEVAQTMRLRVQMTQAAQAGKRPDHPNRIDLRELNDLDRRLLRDALRVARSLQQRTEMDWVRA